MGKILFNTRNIGKTMQIVKIAQDLGIELQSISAADLSRTIGAIAGTAKEQKKPVKIPALYAMPEILIFQGLENDQLDHFLQAYRRAKIEPISLKAVVTMHNRSWSLYELVEELKKEHAAMNH